MKLTWLPRLLGVATAAYGTTITVRPDLFLLPAGLVSDRKQIRPAQRILTRAIGTREIASGLAMATATTPESMRWALGVRVASDTADATLLAIHLRGRPERAKIVGVATGWGVLCALSALTTRR